MFKKTISAVVTWGVLLTPGLASAVEFGVGEIPKGSGVRENENLLQFIADTIKVVLGVVGALLLVLIVYGGFVYATSSGDESKVEKGKNILTYAIVGIVIIAIAFILTDYVIENVLLGQ